MNVENAGQKKKAYIAWPFDVQIPSGYSLYDTLYYKVG